MTRTIPALLLALLGCGESAGPRLDSVDPSSAALGERPLLHITGSGFRPLARVDVGSGKGTEHAEFQGTVGGVAFDRIALRSSTELATTVPVALGVGLHDLAITTPEGHRLELPRAFRVLDPDGGLPDGGPPDGGPPGWPDGPPTAEETFDCSNGRCNGAVAGCRSGGACPSCESGIEWETSRCEWRLEGDRLAQHDENDFGCDVVAASLDFADLHAEASVLVEALGRATPAQVGLVFRADSVCDAENRYYICMLDFTEGLLRLASYDGDGYQNWAQAWEGALAKEPLEDTWYTLRVSAVGDRITCAVDGDPAFLDSRDDTHARGSVGFRTYYARAVFRDLRVWNE